MEMSAFRVLHNLNALNARRKINAKFALLLGSLMIWEFAKLAVT